MVLSAQDIFEEAVVVPRRAFPPLDDLRVIERPGWLQIITPSVTSGGLNEVLFAALDERDADAVIDAAIAEYRALGLKFRWLVGPGSAPADLAERLVQRGLEKSMGRAMARSTESPPLLDDPAIRVAEAEGAELTVFSTVMARGWDVEPAPLVELNRRIVAASRQYHMFVAYRGGEPAAAASYIAFPRSAYLIGGVVLPAHRGHGLYRALVAARLDHARARGLTLATSHARESTSAPILERMGFETIARFPRFFDQ